MGLKRKIMKIVLLLIITVSTQLSSFSQINLVPNPSFEEFTSCPNISYNNIIGLDQICNAYPWFQPNSPNGPECG